MGGNTLLGLLLLAAAVTAALVLGAMYRRPSPVLQLMRDRVKRIEDALRALPLDVDRRR